MGGDEYFLEQRTSSLWGDSVNNSGFTYVNDTKLPQKEYSPDARNYRDRIFNLWNSPHAFMALPVNTYHSRNTYSKERISKYNEQPWGFGFGRWYRDKNDIKHQLSLLGFSDSNYHPQLVLSYTWQKDLYINTDRNFSIGYGCDFFLTNRHETYYMPFPGFTPQLSVQYKDMSITTSWVPWLGNNYGNIFLTTVRWYF